MRLGDKIKRTTKDSLRISYFTINSEEDLKYFQDLQKTGYFTIEVLPRAEIKGFTCEACGG